MSCRENNERRIEDYSEILSDIFKNPLCRIGDIHQLIQADAPPNTKSSFT